MVLSAPRLGLGRHRVHDAVAEVLVDETEGDLVEGGAHGRDLGEDVDAVGVLLDQALQAPDLPPDLAQPGDVGVLLMSLIPVEVAVIREAAERVLLGESLWRIVKDLDARGVPTALDRGWRTNVLTRILTNPRYAGLRAHNGEVVADGAWEPVFDRDTWERLSLALGARPTAGRRNYGARTYPLVGFLACARCGGKLRSARKQNGKRAYSCRKGPGLGGCGSLVILADRVEDEVRQYVIGKLCDPKYRKQLARLAESADDETDILADRLADIEAQRDRLLDLHLEAKVTKAAYERRYEALTAELGGAATQGVLGTEQRRAARPASERRAALGAVGRQGHRLPAPADRPRHPARRRSTRATWAPDVRFRPAGLASPVAARTIRRKRASTSVPRSPTQASASMRRAFATHGCRTSWAAIGPSGRRREPRIGSVDVGRRARLRTEPGNDRGDSRSGESPRARRGTPTGDAAGSSRWLTSSASPTETPPTT